MANTINLVTTFAPYVDEQFTSESKLSLLTNHDLIGQERTPLKFTKSELLQ